METILETIAILFCILAVAYPLVTSTYYIGTTRLGRAQMFMFIGEAVVMSATTAFAILSFLDLLSTVSQEVQSLIRIFMCVVTIYTSRKVHRALRAIIKNNGDR